MMTEPVEGELLPAVRATSALAVPHGPLERHAACHRLVRTSPPPWEAFCGVLIHAAGDFRRQDLPKCQECLTASSVHAQTCGCWKLFEGARLPR